MKIAFDAQPLLSGTKSGIGFCEDGMIKALIKQYPQNQYILEYFCLRRQEQKEKMLEPYMAEQVRLQGCRCVSAGHYKMLSILFPLPHRWLFREQKGLTHFFNYYIPPLVKGKKVVTIHDMVFRVYPETVRKKTLFFLKCVMKKSIRRADKIITDSEFSRQEIRRFYGLQEEKIAVVPCGVDRQVFHGNYSREEAASVKQKYGIEGDYFLYLGTLEPRKNLVQLIQAYAKLLQKEEDCPRLVLAGGKGWMYEEIFHTVTELGMEEEILFTGYVEDQDVPVLMKGAEVFCFPSLYEGFGMPVIEAMACGTPVLTSDGSSLREVAGGAAWLVDPCSAEDIADGLRRLHADPELRRELSGKGLQRAGEYTWEAAGEKLCRVYEEIMGNSRKEE